MTAGCDLKEASYKVGNHSDDELWAAFSRVFSGQSKNTSSYKYGFLKAILDNLYNVDEDLKLTFDQLFGKFTEIYWNLILKYQLKQMAHSKNSKGTLLEQILKDAEEKYCIPTSTPYESLQPTMMFDIEHQVKMKCKEYVVGALFADTNALFYSFSKRKEWIQINPVMFSFICKHKVMIEKLNYYEWARFLEKVNMTSQSLNLLTKIDESSKRSNLEYYRKILFEEFESHTCFYCGKELKKDHIHVDHFIPWSFVKDDNLWNFVLACPECNLRKSSRLPDKGYLDRIVMRNEKLIGVKDLSELPDMDNYQKDRLIHIYDWAQMNGYDRTWKSVRADW